MNFEWHRRAKDCIHHGALTNSKRPECFVFGVYPTHLKRGEGSYVFDTDGKKYVDFICGLGSNLLGYGNEHIGQAISGQFTRGTTLSLSSTLEVEAAEKLKEIIPFANKIRFLKTGSDACDSAIKAARSFHGVETGCRDRALILSEGYHGHDTTFVQLTKPHHGVIRDEYILPLNKETEWMIPKAAAVIVEPIMTDMGHERIKWLNNLREECTKHGTILIFDEIITGFRWPRWSCANYYGISPDIILLGKAIAGGLPLAVMATNQKFDFDSKEWFVSSTFAGETLSLAALMKTIDVLTNIYKIDQLWSEGEDFIKRFNRIWPERLRIDGYPTRGVFTGDDLTKALFFQEACRAGILFGPSFFFNFGHMELKDIVLNSCEDILTRIKSGSVDLMGEMPKSPFAQKMRGQ